MHRLETATEVQDGVLTARIVGEFSAGKTRLLRALIDDGKLASPLLPISSLEPQTCLQLELTYGAEVTLDLIQRVHDTDKAKYIQSFTHFPKRNELAVYDSHTHRLRLTLPDARLVLPQGDGYTDDALPKRLFVIDTPGWNATAEEDDLTRRLDFAAMMGPHNLTLVYVSHANRLDGIDNKQHLQDFLEAMLDACFVGQHSLLFVITHCPLDAAPRLERHAYDMVTTLWEQELFGDLADLDLNVMSIDFATSDEAMLKQFRDRFWQTLLAPVTQHHASAFNLWERALHQCLDAWDVQAALVSAQDTLQYAQALLLRARHTGRFLSGMNAHRVMGLNADAAHTKIRVRWYDGLRCDPTSLYHSLRFEEALPPPQHPLCAWWQIVSGQVQAVLATVERFFKQADKALDQLDPACEDYQDYLDARLLTLYEEALQQTQASLAIFLKHAVDLASVDDVTQHLASLLKLSLLYGFYEDLKHPGF